MPEEVEKKAPSSFFDVRHISVALRCVARRTVRFLTNNGPTIRTLDREARNFHKTAKMDSIT